MITLESAKLAFDRWRTSKTNVNSATPTELWGMVDQLLLTHKRVKVCKVLGISGHQVKSNCTTISPTKAKASPLLEVTGDFVEATPTQFIEDPSVEVGAVAKTGMSKLTVKGRFKSLHLCVPTAALREVLPMLGELL